MDKFDEKLLQLIESGGGDVLTYLYISKAIDVLIVMAMLFLLWKIFSPMIKAIDKI